MNPRLPRAFPRFAIYLAFLALVGSATYAAEGFSLPTTAGWHTWEAESASGGDRWRLVSDPSASGGTYVEAAVAGATLEFPVEVAQETAVSVRPLWWRTSERRAARRFPYPLTSLVGPDALDTCSGLVCFTAPAAGRVGLLDPTTEKPVGSIHVGGYLTDLVADPQANLLYVADALADRVIIVDPLARSVVGEIATPAEPWSLSLGGGRLYVACRSGRCIAVLDPGARRQASEFRLPAAPISVQYQAGDVPSVVVRFQHRVYHVETLAAEAADQVQYSLPGARSSASYGADKSYDMPRPGTLRLRTKGESREFDVSALCGQTAGADSSLLVVGDRLLFTCPATGHLGVFDPRTDTLLPSVYVGGRPTDLCLVRGNRKLCVADAAQPRVLVLDAADLTVIGQVRLPGVPVSLEWVESYALQRDYLVPPTPVRRLFVACRDPGALVTVDVDTRRVERQVPLSTSPARVRLIPLPDTGWWPLIADHHIGIALTPRVAVELEPRRLDATTGEPADGPTPAGAVPRRAAVKVRVGDVERTFEGNNELLVRVDGKREVDVSAIADPQLLPAAPLTGRDAPGSLSFALDGGPPMDWTRKLWMRPDNNMLLVSDSEEYWQENAPRLRLLPGRHTLRVTATGPCVRLDAIAVRRALEDTLSVEALPLPREIHGEVPSSSYQGVFYDQERVRFLLQVRNSGSRVQGVQITGTVRNYLGEVIGQVDHMAARVQPGDTWEQPVELQLADTGRLTLRLEIESDGGCTAREVRFVRLPRLEHPRILFRKSDLPAIEERIAKHPRLFRRWADWLVRQCQQEGSFPQRFLPPGVTAAEMVKAAPPGTSNPHNTYAWRMYELGWRMIACQFAARYVPGADSAALDAKLEPLLAAARTDGWVQYHYHGPFFPGAVEAVVDMAPDELRSELPLTRQFAASRGNMDVFPWTLLSLEEPLTPRDRALVYEIATMHNNFQRYFETHAGVRGGTLWQNPWTGCYCPTQGMLLSFLFTREFFGEDRLFQAPFIQGFFTFHRYVDPISDPRNILPSHRGPMGEPWRWIFTSLCRHPLEKTQYRWEEWLAKLEGDLPQPEERAVDELFALKDMPFTGQLVGGAHHFVTGAVVPIALALGWYEPTAPEVKREELPTTALFDFEGWATMRTGWDADATEVFFVSGVRDHTYKLCPNHFSIAKGGEFLIGTPPLWGDDGNCTPAWGNTVVAGDQWLRRWQLSLHGVRAEENAIIDRFSPLTWSYIARDRRLCGYSPAEGGFGGGLDMHGHTETILAREGQVIAYETRPEYDYVAGDASLAWPCSEMRSHTRQLLFLKPDTVVVYDRVLLGPEGTNCRWLAATGPDLVVAGSGFTVGAGKARLLGQVLLPVGACVSRPEVLPCWNWRDVKLLEIRSGGRAAAQEFLVVMQVGNERLLSRGPASVSETEDEITAWVPVEGGTAEVTFARRGPVGGRVALATVLNHTQQLLATEVRDTYEHWRGDPRYAKWVSDPRFRFIMGARQR